MVIITANKIRLKIYSLILLSSLLIPMIANEIKNENCYVALIIDDFGNGTPDTQDFLDLDVKFTGAVMPALEHSESDALALKNHGKEIILHMPMEPHKGKKSWLGPNGITSDLSNEQIEKNISDSLAQLKFAIGINNHMGSKAMEDERIVDVLFKTASEKNLLIVDSKTTPHSKATMFSQKYNVKLYERDIFIDAPDINKVRENLRKTIKIAMSKKFAIAIGHVGPAGGKITAQAIKEIYDEYKNQHVHFVTVSELERLVTQKLSTILILSLIVL